MAFFYQNGDHKEGKIIKAYDVKQKFFKYQKFLRGMFDLLELAIIPINSDIFLMYHNQNKLLLQAQFN